jgi:CspA family cold shock protein
MTKQDQQPFFGVVKFFSEEAGYGFIIPDSGGTDVFVHGSALQHKGIVLVSGERVGYSVAFGGNKRAHAVDVFKVEDKLDQKVDSDDESDDDKAWSQHRKMMAGERR